MAGASRCIMLLANPLYSLFHPVRPSPSLLHLTRHAHLFPSSLSHIHHHHHELHLNTLSFTSLQHPLKLLPSKPKSSRSHLHIQSQLTVPDDAHSPSSQYRWPEFCKLLDVIPRRQHSPAVANYDISPDDAFLTDEDFPHEFLSAARDCLTFSHSQPDLLGSLSTRDLEVVVENGTPFLFKSELDSARRMRAFLGIGGSTVSESNRAHTVDLMKYLLSYASNPTISSQPNNLCSTEPLISSCRNLLNELTEMSYRLSRSGLSAPHQYQFSSRFEQPPRLYGRNIEMKRGDWICPKCSFMNFARNVKCPKCEEPRPQRQLNGGEWECPQCDFFNYGRNIVCLRCDCKRPGETSFSTISSSLGLINSNMDYENKTDVDRGLAANEEKAQLWFSKVSQLSNASDLSSAADDENFPEILPLRKGVNRSVVSTRKTPLERRLANSQHRRNMGNDVSQEDNYSVSWGASKRVDSPVNQRPNQILVERSSMSKADSCLVSSGQNVGTGSSMMPSVSDSPQYEQQEGDDSNCSSVADEPKKSGEHILFSGKPEMQAGSLYKEREQAEKSDRWFKRVAELHDIKDLTSEISDVDFPEIMPIRKGENRFVVSKKKDRSLTSPMYKRQVAVQQANSGNHVPFVPFPPGYFAKKDKQQVEDTDSTVQSTTESISSLKKEGSNNMICAERVENQQTNTVKWNSNSFGSSRLPMNGDSAKNSSNSQTITEEAQVSGYSEKVNSPETTSMSGGSSQLPQNQNVSSWTGKSLEGSAVKEPDPLDMSEEAKAERWFRRVAQIKDISELSQIPDEDFPSIMPMRKGVNRFVVSKRKTPLERRLTSHQYRRNLPIESCDPAKKETDSS